MGKTLLCVCMCAVDLELLGVSARQYKERCSSSHMLEDKALFLLRRSTSSHRRLASSETEQQEEVSLLPQTWGTAMVQGEECAGIVLGRQATVGNA